MSRKNKRKMSRQLSGVSAAQPMRTSEFNPDYTNTKRELRRIAILAGTFFAILVILAIFQKPILALFIK
jgi:hypothetical protein